MPARKGECPHGYMLSGAMLCPQCPEPNFGINDSTVQHDSGDETHVLPHREADTFGGLRPMQEQPRRDTSALVERTTMLMRSDGAPRAIEGDNGPGGVTARGDARRALKLRAGEYSDPGTPAPPFKENNPKDGLGSAKASLSFCSMPVLLAMAVGMAEGGYKYGAHNYRVAGPRASVYTDGAIRHISDFTEGVDIDAESGVELHHIIKAMCSLHVIADAIIQGTWVDDRPPPSPPGWLAKLNAMMVQLQAKNPAPVARYLANDKRGPGRIL